MSDPWETLFDIGKLGEVIKLLIKSALYWAILCGLLLYFSWDLWPLMSEKKWFFLIFFIVCLFISGAHYYAWVKHGKKLDKNVENKKQENDKNVEDKKQENKKNLEQIEKNLDYKVLEFKRSIIDFYSKFDSLKAKCQRNCEGEEWNKLNTELVEYYSAIQNFSFKKEKEQAGISNATS